MQNSLALLVASLLLSACVSSGSAPESSAPTYAAAPDPDAPRPQDLALARPWCEDFLQPAGLVADTVTIEGPPGLLEHVATSIDPQHHTQNVETVPEGLRQTFEARVPNSQVEIRAWLDQLEIATLQRLVVLERPGGREIIVRATGDAWWKEIEGPGQRRAAQLELRGLVAAR